LKKRIISNFLHFLFCLTSVFLFIIMETNRTGRAPVQTPCGFAVAAAEGADMKTVRWIAIVLALCMLAAVLLACGKTAADGEEPNGQKETKGQETQSGETGGEAETEPEDPLLTLEKRSFSKETVTILCRDDKKYEISVDEPDGDIVSDAVYARNNRVEEYLDVSLEMIPRSTIAQKMDVQSSQTSLAGYVAVVNAAAKLPKILPMMVTPAGTINPARVFIIGVGVAGLQAIATAKRLGARVDAFDTRPVVEEQVKSLGASFVKIDLGEMGQTAQGYAKELTPEQIAKQKEAQAKVCERSNIVITTAKVFGRKAPRLIEKNVLDRMMPGSIVVDMAVSTGGNVEGSKLFENVVTENGVTIMSGDLLERQVPFDASKMFSGNITAFLTHFYNKESKEFEVRMEDDIMKGCLLTQGGQIIHERFKEGN
jgi:NAD/NADP transhydrogenase alpha subunit